MLHSNNRWLITRVVTFMVKFNQWINLFYRLTITWIVVSFKNTDEISTVPENWLKIEDDVASCYWPPSGHKHTKQKIRKAIIPDETKWELFPDTIIKTYGMLILIKN